MQTSLKPASALTALHRLVYLLAPLGVLHFWWMVKKDITEPVLYATLLAVLLGWRVVAKLAESRRRVRAIAGTQDLVTPRGGRQRA